MITRSRTTKMLLAAASFSLVAAACGSDANDDGADATDAPAAAIATTAPVDRRRDGRDGRDGGRAVRSGVRRRADGG